MHLYQILLFLWSKDQNYVLFKSFSDFELFQLQQGREDYEAITDQSWS